MAKVGNICARSNVSATMFPSLARPLPQMPVMLQGGGGGGGEGGGNIMENNINRPEMKYVRAQMYLAGHLDR